jgi:hypothetical protein
MTHDPARQTDIERRLANLAKAPRCGKRATREGLREDELALFDLLQKEGLDKSSRDRG